MGYQADWIILFRRKQREIKLAKRFNLGQEIKSMSSKKQDNLVLGAVFGMIALGFVQTEQKLWSMYEHDKTVLEQRQRGLSYGAAKKV